jgi:chitodextrinase
MRRLALGLLFVLPVFCQTGPKLLFKSGFENATYLDPTYNSSYQYIRGSDQSTGYSWPIGVFSPHPELTGIQNVISSNQASHLAHAIQTVPGPNGSATTALLLKLTSPALSQTCCIQAALQTASLGVDVRDVYVRYWTKMNPEFASQAKALTTSFWRMAWEMKTATDYRITPMIYADSTGRPYWYIKGDNNAAGCGSACQTFWTVINKTVPVPTDRWFLMEFYLHRSTGSDGRVFWGVDGQTIADHMGPNIGINNEKINVIMYKNLYGPENAFPMYEWMDDLEIWDRPPCTNLPCGAPAGGGTSDAQTPTVPTNVTASAASSSQINLSWSASSDNVGIAGYRIYRNGGTTPITTVNGTSYQNAGLAAGTTYTYTVAAYDAAGNVSGNSSPASATTASAATPPPPPSTPNLVRGRIPTGSTTLYTTNYITDGDYTLANVGGAGSGPQWILFDLGQTYALDTVKVWHYADGRVYRDVIVQVSNDATFASGVTTVFNNDTDNSAGQGAGTNAEYPEPGTGQNIPISKVNARYVRLWSNGSNMSEWNHYGEVEVYGSAATVQQDTQAPTAPQNLTGSAASSSQINLSWTASTDNVGVAGYRIYVNGATTPLTSVTGTTYQHTGLSASTTYSYTVAAYDAAGNASARSVIASITTAPLSTAPVQNLARGRMITGSTTLYAPNYITDGDYTVANVGGAGSGPQWIQIDLGQSYALDHVKVWHYADSRIYRDVIVQVSTDPNFASGVKTVFNNDADNSAGQGAGTDPEYPEAATGQDFQFQPVNGRYVRLWSNGSTMNEWNHYGEVEVYGSANTSTPQPPPAALSVAVTSPVANATIRRGARLDFGATVTGSVTSVRYRVDGVVVATGTAPAFSAGWTVVSSTTGWRIVDAVAVDAAGNTATSQGVRIKVR